MNRLPVVIETEIHIRSVEVKTLHAKSRMLGARHGDFILIEEPVYQISERLASPIFGEVLCWFFHEGDIYRFATRIREGLGTGLTLLDYPEHFQVESIRNSHRIQVNIETRLYLGPESWEAVDLQKRRGPEDRGTIVDISEGGCRLRVPMLTHAVRNMTCWLEFVLPDNQPIGGLRCKVCNVQYQKIRKSMEMGLQFVGPPDQISMIRSFCSYCMFFKV